MLRRFHTAGGFRDLTTVSRNGSGAINRCEAVIRLGGWDHISLEVNIPAPAILPKYGMRYSQIIEAKMTPAHRLVSDMKGHNPLVVAHLYEEGYDEVSLQTIYVEHHNRKYGEATDYMKELCRLASKYRVTLYLEAMPEDDNPEYDMTLDQLANFYRKFGFEGDTIKDGGIMMVREP